jgi:hypothetical protein
MTQITIDLPENLVQSAQHLGKATARDLSDILTDTLEIILPVFNDLSQTSNYKAIDHLSDPEVIEVADLKMDLVQNQRLGELQSKGKEIGLTQAESYELLVLMSIYRIGQLRKAMALAEVTKRGLREPLLP